MSRPGGWKEGLNEEEPELVWSSCLDCPSHTPEACARVCFLVVVLVVVVDAAVVRVNL